MLAECADRKWLQDRSVRRNPAGSGGQMALFGKKQNFIRFEVGMERANVGPHCVLPAALAEEA
jgi:hypothetical protein